MSVLLTELIADAIKENDVDALSVLDGCDALNEPNSDGEIPLIQCIRHDRPNLFKMLLEMGANLHADGNGPQPIDCLQKARRLGWIEDRLLGNPLGNPPITRTVEIECLILMRVTATSCGYER